MIYGHIIMGVCLFLVAMFVVKKNGTGALIFMVLFCLTFQLTNGTVFWVYVAEVCSDSAMGFSVTLMMITLLLQSLFSNTLIGYWSVQTLFYILGGFQVATILACIVSMRETKGLSNEQKGDLYKAKRVKNVLPVTQRLPSNEDEGDLRWSEQEK